MSDQDDRDAAARVPLQPAAVDAVGAADLRRRIAELEDELAVARSTGSAPRTQTSEGLPRRHRQGSWRVLVTGVLVALAALTAPLSVVATWARGEVGDTERYVQTVAPLADDPAIQSAIAERVSSEIFTVLDVEALTQEAVDALAELGLPPRVSVSVAALSSPLARGVEGFVSEQVLRLVQSDEFATAWTTVNRAAHVQMVALLTGEGSDTLDVSGGTVSLDIGPIIAAAKAQLVDSGFALAERIPEIETSFTLLESPDLVKAQTAFSLLDQTATWLPWLGLLLLATAVYVSRSRRRTLVAAGLAVAGAMLALGALLNVARPLYLGAVPPNALPQDAAAVVYDSLVLYIRTNLRAALLVALVVALAAWLAGSGSVATTVRRSMLSAFAATRGGAERAGLRTGPVGAAAFRFRSALRVVVVAIAALTYMLADYPTGAWTLGLLGVMLAVLALLELVATPPAEPPRAAGDDALAGDGSGALVTAPTVPVSAVVGAHASTRRDTFVD